MVLGTGAPLPPFNHMRSLRRRAFTKAHPGNNTDHFEPTPRRWSRVCKPSNTASPSRFAHGTPPARPSPTCPAPLLPIRQPASARGMISPFLAQAAEGSPRDHRNPPRPVHHRRSRRSRPLDKPRRQGPRPKGIDARRCGARNRRTPAPARLVAVLLRPRPAAVGSPLDKTTAHGTWRGLTGLLRPCQNRPSMTCN